VDVSLTPEQQELTRTVRAFCAQHATPELVRRASATERGHDPAVWRALAQDLGLAGLAIPAAYGGAGAGWLEVGLALAQTGGALLPSPLLSTLVAGAAVLATADEAAAADILPALAAGEEVGTVAVAEASGRWDTASVQTRAEPGPGGWLVTGVKDFVLDAVVADLLVVAALADDGVGLFAVRARGPGVTRVAHGGLDQTRRQARVTLRDAAARRLGPGGPEGEAAVDTAVDLMRVALAAEAAGGARRCLASSVAHLAERVQFGRQLGSFQALQHRCADLAVQVEAAEATVLSAAWTAAELPAELPVVGPLAKAVCGSAYRSAAAENVQLHGGMGFTWEHDAHLHLKRATTTELLLGDTRACRLLVADRVGL